jgi:hypothetical protein
VLCYLQIVLLGMDVSKLAKWALLVVVAVNSKVVVKMKKYKPVNLLYYTRQV